MNRRQFFKYSAILGLGAMVVKEAGPDFYQETFEISYQYDVDKFKLTKYQAQPMSFNGSKYVPCGKPEIVTAEHKEEYTTLQINLNGEDGWIMKEFDKAGG